MDRRKFLGLMAATPALPAVLPELEPEGWALDFPIEVQFSDTTLYEEYCRADTTYLAELVARNIMETNEILQALPFHEVDDDLSA